MLSTIHERPGVYSSYDASAVFSGSAAARVVGLAAPATKGTENESVTLTGYAAALAAFGEDETGTVGMSTLCRLLFAGGVGTVVAVKTAAETPEGYADAFDALAERENVDIVLCASALTEVHQALRKSVEEASAARRERIAVVGGSGETAEQLVTHAAAINSERVVLVGPDGLDETGKAVPAVCCAAAVAAAIAVSRDPAVPLNGAALQGLGGLQTRYSESDIDLLVRGGVTPLEESGGTVSPIRGITTRTTTGGAADSTWRELTTILIVDDVIPAIRRSLRAKFARSKNTAQTRGAIRAQVVVELENRVKAEVIDSYGPVTAYPSEEEPTVCVVEFGFAVAHGLNQIYLTAHITV